jgi:hemolysin activation/secretion protein
VRIRDIFLPLVAGSITLASPAAALAQADPASLEHTIPKFETNNARTVPKIAAPAARPPENARLEGTFILGAVNITGSTVFSSEELAKSFEPYLASRVGQAELNRIVTDITNRYRRAGYLLSYAVLPEQSVTSGIVNIRVVEGFISDVRIEGDTRSASAAKAAAVQLLEDRPLRNSRLERSLAIIRKIPGATLKDATLSRSVNDPRQHVLTIVLGGARVTGIVYSDNRGTIEGARARAYSSISAASVLTSGDQLQLDLFAIPSDEFRYWYGQAKASVPLNSNGLRLSVSASRGAQFGRTSGGNEHGNSRQFTGELIVAPVQSRTFELNGHLSLSDWLSKETMGGNLVQRDRLDVARFWLDLAHIAKNRVDVRFGVSQGLDLGSATRSGDQLATRPFGSAKFTKFNADIQMIAPLSNRIYLRADSMAQISTKPLLASEEFALGGSRIGRSQDFNAATGDSGLGAMAEMNYRLSNAKSGPKDLTLFFYADGGAAFRKRPSAGLPRHQWLAGIGTGARFTSFGIIWSGELGVPLHSPTKKEGVRLFVSGAHSF